jgi:hypothetical protein
MKHRQIKISFITLFTIGITACTKPYAPPPINAVTGYLVVEGVINAGNNASSVFRLNRVVNLDSTSNAPVINAQVSIQGKDNTSYTLTGDSAGVYTSAPLQLSSSGQYRIYIKTSNGEEYSSAYEAVKVTPSIDTIAHVIESNGVQLNLNTHDPNNDTRYYRWDYSETWEFHSMYDSEYISNGDTVLGRPASEQVYYCFASDSSTSILLGSSAKLVQDVISTAPIAFVPAGSEKIEKEYSIIVHQYALTSDAYNFWANLKKNTEQLGSIFDAQPSQIYGNIQCITNPKEPVIGYISASTIQSKRIFIDGSTLPNWRTTYPYNCGLDTTLFVRHFLGGGVIYEEDLYFNYLKGAAGTDYLPISPVFDPVSGALIGHMRSTTFCADCTIRGTTKFPAFWPFKYY